MISQRRVLGPKNGGRTFLRNVGNYLLVDEA